MFKLMKYEFRKQAFSKLILIVLAVILELVFFAGIFFDKDELIGFSVSFLILFTFGTLFFLSYEAIFTFYNDLKQKCSYMLFLTPNTSYQIIGAKVLSAAIQIVLAGIILFLMASLDIVALNEKYDSLARAQQMIKAFFEQMYNIHITLPAIISVGSFIIISWVRTLTVGFFSIALSATFLANKKLNGLASFGIFIVINVTFSYLVAKIMKLIMGPSVDNYFDITKSFFIQSICMLIFLIITYVGTAWMLDKKVSV